MLDRTMALVRKDLLVFRRDSVATYLVGSPFLLVGIVRLVLPSDPRSPLVAISASMLAFSVLLVAGVLAGLSIVDEKESGAIGAYAVSPLGFQEYVAAKLGTAALVGVLLATGSTLCLTGLDVSIGRLVVAIVASLPVGLVLGVLVGALAKEQLGAMALLKGLLFFFTSVPIGGFVLHGRASMALWPFPNHWAVQSVFGALSGGELARPALLAAGTGLAALGASLWLLRRRVGLGTS